MRSIIRSKIQKATVTQAELHYVGSITLDQDLIEKAGLWEGEKVLIVSVTSGAPGDLCHSRRARFRDHQHQRRGGTLDQEGGRDHHLGLRDHRQPCRNEEHHRRRK